MPVMNATFGTFADGGDLQFDDQVVGLRDGVNTRFSYQGAPGVYLPLAGGTMEGAIDMDNNSITGLPSPTLDSDAANKAFVLSLTAAVGAIGTIQRSNGSNWVASVVTYPDAYALGDVIYASAANVLTALAGNITTTKQYLSQTGTGAVSQAPAWSAISGSDITGAALSKTDDTNVTLTLGGTPLTALLRAASLTLGWTGQLSLTRGGTNASLVAAAGAIAYSTASAFAFSAVGSSGQLFQSAGAGAPGWTTATYPSTAGSSGNVLTSDGTNWISSAPATSGTVTSVATNNGLTGGTITTTGTLGLASVANLSILANISGGATFPSANTLTAIIDAALGSTQGNILYRNATVWTVLAPGTSGEFLQTQGAGANPQWAPESGGGTVTSITQGSGMTFSTTPITSSGTVSSNQQNSIIGGNFDTNPWQRGTSFTAPATSAYSADRFRLGLVGAGVINLIKTADAPTVGQAGIFTQYCLDWDVTTADASIAATDQYFMNYRIEGYDWAQLAQRAFTISFWVKSTKTGIFSVSFRNLGGDRVYVSEYTVLVTDTWELKTVTVSASPSAGTWDYTNGIGLIISWVVAAGSNFQTSSLNTWNSDGLYCSSNQVNGMDSASNNFKLQLIKVEPGSVATGWVNRSEEEELALCQRYYEKTFNIATAPVTGVTVGGMIAYSVATLGVSNRRETWSFATKKRAAPTMTFYNPVTANTNWYNANVAADSGAPTATYIGDRSSIVNNPQVAGDLIGTLCILNATADAEL